MQPNENFQPLSAELRPTLLTVLCVLTFIGSGWGVFGGIRSYASADMSAAMVNQTLDQTKDRISDQPNSGFASKILNSVSAGMSPTNIRKSAIVNVVSCLFTLLGGILMWQLRKVGFYSYVVGTIIGAVTPLLILGGVVAWATSGWVGFIGLIFIILYGVNLNYMTR